MHCSITRINKIEHELINCHCVPVLLVFPQQPDSVEDVGGIPSILSGRKFTMYVYVADVMMCSLCIAYCCLIYYLNHTWCNTYMIRSHGPRCRYLFALPLLCAILALFTVAVETRLCEAVVCCTSSLHRGALPRG